MLSKLFLITLVLAGLLLEVQTARAIPQVADYQSLSLEDCLTIAHKENPVLSASREKIQELVADYQAARSSFFPRLTLLSYSTQQPADRFVSGGIPPPGLFAFVRGN
jgi:outer membrane protein TolC